MNIDDETLYALSQRVGSLLLDRSQMLAAAESCTGGWVCQCLTEVAGSSRWFDRGFVTYSNEAKRELLGVEESILVEQGAVSEATVRAMTAGVLRNSQADCALAISGIAGPGGATVGKPVGTVWFAWQRRNGDCIARREWFDGDRRAVRRQAVALALQGILDLYAGDGP
ncbi:MAG: nicotinamide-nucleotide amidase [Methylococcaceae bacterium]|nr:nicotinamide-nucleotide amidase [Methylococcaceae bacterium]